MVIQRFSDLLMEESGIFMLHMNCKNPIITNLKFAEDAIHFCRANDETAASVQIFLRKFAEEIGLLVNKAKSQIFFSSCHKNTHIKLASILGIPIGILPFKYLGIPVTSKRLSFKDYAAH